MLSPCSRMRLLLDLSGLASQYLDRCIDDHLTATTALVVGSRDDRVPRLIERLKAVVNE